MNNTELYFNLRDSKELRAFAQMIRELNETGVPYEVKQESGDNLSVILNIGDGY